MTKKWIEDSDGVSISQLTIGVVQLIKAFYHVENHRPTKPCNKLY